KFATILSPISGKEFLSKPRLYGKIVIIGAFGLSERYNLVFLNKQKVAAKILSLLSFNLCNGQTAQSVKTIPFVLIYSNSFSSLLSFINSCLSKNLKPSFE